MLLNRRTFAGAFLAAATLCASACSANSDRTQSVTGPTLATATSSAVTRLTATSPTVIRPTVSRPLPTTKRVPPTPSTKAALAAKSAASRSRSPARTAPAYVPTATVTGAPTLNRAVAYATHHGGYRVGLAVLDTRTNQLYGAGLDRTRFATESVVKAFIATRLLATHTMTPVRRTIAYKMITQSDDASGTALYGAAGGDDLVPWIARHYRLGDIGAPPTRAGWWGNTHITAVGLVRFYAAVRKDPAVWPWLSAAMHHARSHGSDGTYQFFGLKQADPDAAIKQGWGQDDDDWRASSDFNSTGFVDDDRYAVAILLKGPHWQYRTGSPAMVTSVARLIFDGDGAMHLG